jgi:hypothetical protein
MKRNSIPCLLLFIAAAGSVFGTADASNNDTATGLVGSDDRRLLRATTSGSTTSASAGARPSPSRPSGPSGFSGPSLSGPSGSSSASRPRPSPTFSSPSRPLSPSGPLGSTASQPSRPQPSPTLLFPSRRSPPTNTVPTVPFSGSVPTFRPPLWPQPSMPYASPFWVQSSSPSELFSSPDQASIPLWTTSAAAASRVSRMFVFAVLGLVFGSL